MKFHSMKAAYEHNEPFSSKLLCMSTPPLLALLTALAILGGQRSGRPAYSDLVLLSVFRIVPTAQSYYECQSLARLRFFSFLLLYLRQFVISGGIKGNTAEQCHCVLTGGGKLGFPSLVIRRQLRRKKFHCIYAGSVTLQFSRAFTLRLTRVTATAVRCWRKSLSLWRGCRFDIVS